MELWISTVYNDEQVQGAEVGPVVYLRNGTGLPVLNYSELAVRWGISKATVGRILKKLAGMDYISLMTFPGRRGSVIYLQNYLSTMFQISDVLIDKEEVAMVLNIKVSLPDEEEKEQTADAGGHDICVSDELASVSKSNIEVLVEKMAKVLEPQGISCFRCAKSKYKLFPLSDACREEYLLRAREESEKQFGLMILCGSDTPVYTFELTLSPIAEKNRGNLA